MTKIHKTAILILAFVGWLGPHPAPAVGRQYQLGTTYDFDYETTVQINENPASGREVGFKVAAKVSLTNVWQNAVDPNERLMKLQVSGAKLQVHSVHTKDHHLQDHGSSLDKVVPQAAYVHWLDGRPTKIYLPAPAAGKDDPTADLLRGLAGLFQIHPAGSDSSATIEEDVSGRCHVLYTKKSDVSLEKRRWGCSHPQGGQFSHYNLIQSVTTGNEASYLYELFRDGSVKNVQVTEKAHLAVNLWKKASLQVRADSTLKFLSERTGEKTVQASGVVEALNTFNKKGQYSTGDSLAFRKPTPNTECQFTNCKPLNTVVKEYRERLKTENLAKVKSANAFLRVLEAMRVASQKDIESVLKDTKNKKVLPQLLDVVAAAQTQNALKAGLSIVDLNNSDQAERFILCLGLTSHPDENLIKELLNLAKKQISNEKVKATLLTTIGNVARSFCELIGSEQECGKIVKSISDYLVHSLDACKDDGCRLPYLRGFVNAGLPDTASSLIPYVIKGGKLGSVALRALKSIGGSRLNETTSRVLIDVYHQLRRQYDSTCRTLAAEVLLSTNEKKQDKVLREMIKSLSNQQAPEVNTFFLAKLFEMAETDKELSDTLRKITKDPTLWNYYILAQNGVSAAYTRPFGESSGANASYGINMEFLPGGVLKRSSFDVGLHSGNTEMLLMLSVGLYAEGIGSFGGSGGDEDNEAEKEETSAGMELTAFDMRLRPYTFFTGTGELMGLVWSGTGSEPTPALQANLLMNDHQQTMALHNGLLLDLNLVGGLSTDLSGSIQISLWNRNSHSLVKTSGALLLHGAARVYTPFAKAHLEFAMGGEAYVDFVTDLDFYEKPFKMCIQMDQKPFSFRYNVRKSESVPGSKHLVRTLRRRTVHVSGKSFAMHKKNIDTCAIMLQDA